MVELRVHGLPEEVNATLAWLRASFVVLSETKPYPDRAPSKFVRVYLTIKAEPAPSEREGQS